MKKIFLILLLLLCGCTKDKLTTKQFISKMKENNFEVISSIDQFNNYDYVLESFIANNDNYQIEFYIIDENYSDYFYNLNVEIFTAAETNESLVKKIDKENFKSYELTTSEKFMYISKVDNTILYVDVDVDYKNSVKKILKKIDY